MTLVEFIRAMPDSWPHPDPIITRNLNDKYYDLDWEFERHKVISISVCDSGEIVWSYINGDKKDYGAVKNPDKMPQEIIDMFKEFGVV